MKQTSPLRKIAFIFLTLLLVAGLVSPAAVGPGAAPTAFTSVILQSASAGDAAALAETYGGTVTSSLEIINGVAARVPTGQLLALRADPRAAAVTPNQETVLTRSSFEKKKRNPETDYPDVTGADLAWAAGATGKGVTVAVLDTGIALHPELLRAVDGKVRAPVVGWVDFVDGKKVPIDPNGHGTHIAGIIVNASKGADGEYNGMAPGARLVGVRVLDKTGVGDYEKVIRGIQWVIKNKTRLNIQVINLSLCSLVQSPYWADPLNQAVMRAWAEGITVVVAAGNHGSQPLTIAVPGNNPYVITAGAFTDNYTPLDWNDDYLTPFSSAGPTLDGFVKPDLLAPGAHITSTMMPGSYIARKRDANWVNGLYFSMAGTSQAAAVVSGAAAQVLSQNPGLTPDQVKYRLTVTALPWINTEQTDVLYSAWQQGAGRLNVYDAAFGENLTGSANAGLDIQADLTGAQHFEGFSYYDEAAGMFKLRGFEAEPGGYGSWAGGYGSWAGGYGSWAGGYGSWAGGYGSWAGGYGSWAGGYGSWAGGYGSWAGGYGSWAGGYGSWAGGYGSWAGGYGSWAGSFGAVPGQLVDPAFVTNFVQGISPNPKTSTSTIGIVEE
jgi:serine protease AprX